MAGFMMITSFISLWISDTACAALMSPIAVALLETIMLHKMHYATVNKNDIAMRDYGQKGMRNLQMFDVDRCTRVIDRWFYPNENTGISYLSWMAIAVPPMIGYMVSSWMIVQIQFLGFRHISRIFMPSREEDKIDEDYAHKAVLAAYNDLGPITFAEKSTLVIFLLTVFSWITSDPKVINGWATFMKSGYVTDTCSGMLAVFMLFVWPREMPDFVFLRSESEQLRPSVRREALLTWDAVRRRFPWSVILLLGAGFAISKSVKESGLSSLIACNLEHVFFGFPLLFMQICISFISVVLTEFSTNSATASIIIPIAFNIAESVRAHPLYFSIPATIGPSFSFMLPMATPPNAIVYESGMLRMIDMVTSGIFLNVFCIAITVLNMNTWVYWLFSMNNYPDYALHHNNTSPCHI
ncbi:sodium:sulfate symporter transmembrane region [Dictyocaulus viviparus]|uniref:Sodium:sulfate symporter transmembrane region n=1 Tax=Dictyocaulus viviparus TaxID=29172 RepID=A0A0D8XVX1_DICVI|nr:sodium:sulfate symporter transmembrane region [Dictyocaulus viviparus]